ncbi:182 kDa tankyrase-1-binding protein [Melanotaenia boesemani]|uniref:182 kDa tankyrase-1-binding protein n=1 Tax=Melanotaenia boesemani TaxID=1250792 RepID=UPI001C0462D3|nr:182 kDa tankyrase-1-binding protein [Melanotaenia boesemani]
MESSDEASQSGDASKPAPTPKPLFTPKPFSLQRNTRFRSIHAPKSNRVTSTAKPEHPGRSEATGSLKLPLTPSALNPSKPTSVSAPEPSSVSAPAEKQPKTTKESEAPPHKEATLDSSAEILESSPKKTPPKEAPEPVQKDNVIQTNHNASVEAVTNFEQKDGEEKDESQLSVAQKLEEGSSDSAPKTSSTPQRGGSRKRISMELTSKFESGGLSLPSQPTVSTTSTKDSSDKSAPSSPEQKQTIPETPKEVIDAGGQKEDYSGGSSIKRRISLLFDSSSRPEVMTKREEPEIMNCTGGVKERIRNWAAEKGSEGPNVEKKPEVTTGTCSKGSEPAAVPAAEITPQKLTPEVPEADEASPQAVDPLPTVAPAKQPTETQTEKPKDAVDEDKSLESASNASGEQNKAAEGDVQLRSRILPAADEGDSAAGLSSKRNNGKRRSVRFGTVVADDGGPPVILGSEPESSTDEEEEKEKTPEDETEEDVPVSVPVYRRVGIFHRKDDDLKRNKEKILKNLEFEKKQKEEESEQARLKLEEGHKLNEEREKEKAKQRDELRLKEEEMERQRMQELERERLKEEEVEKVRRMELLQQRQKEEEEERLKQEEEREKERRKKEEERKKEQLRKEAEERERFRRLQEEEQLRERQRQEEEERKRIELEKKLQQEKEEEMLKQEKEEEMKRMKERQRQEEEEERKRIELEKKLKQEKEEEEERKRIELEKKLKQEKEEEMKRMKERQRQEEEEERKRIELEKKLKQEKEEEMKRMKERQRQEEEEERKRIELEKKLKQEKEEEMKRMKERQRKEEEEERKRIELERKLQQEKEEEMKRMKERQRQEEEEERKRIELEKKLKQEKEEEMRRMKERQRQEEEEERKRIELKRKLQQEKEEEEERMRQIEKQRAEERKRQMEKERAEAVERKMLEELERKQVDKLEEKLRMGEGKERKESKPMMREEESVVDKGEQNLISFDSENFTHMSETLYSPPSNVSKHTESLIDVVFDDFSIKKPLIDMDFDDFSVKPKKWGSRAKVETAPISCGTSDAVAEDELLVSMDVQPQESQEKVEKENVSTSALENLNKNEVEGEEVEEEEEEKEEQEQQEEEIERPAEEQLISVEEEEKEESEEENADNDIEVEVEEDEAEEDDDEHGDPSIKRISCMSFATMQYLEGKLSSAQLQLAGWVGNVRQSLQGTLDLVWGHPDEKQAEEGGDEEEEKEEGGDTDGRSQRAVSPLRIFARRSRRYFRHFSIRNRQTLERRATEFQSAHVNSYCTSNEDKDTDALTDGELHTQDGVCEQTPETDSPKLPPDLHSEDADTTDAFSETNLSPLPEISTSLLDTSAQRSKADVGKKRFRSRPSRSLRVVSDQKGKLDRQVHDTTGGKEVSFKQNESDFEEEQPKTKAVCSPPPSSQRVSMFPGPNAAALIAQIKQRTGGGGPGPGEETKEDKVEEKEYQDEEVVPSPPQPSRSPRSAAHLAGAALVLPPLGNKDRGAVSSPAWLKELKSKKRMSQHGGET